MKIKKISIFMGIMLSIISLFALFAYATPQGASNVTISSSGRNSGSTAAVEIDAYAGNVTALVIQGTRSTEAWQGYYGNITGTIVLDDADNFTLYDWALPKPSGEVYASNGSSVTWADVYCMNVSGISINNTYNGILYNINATQIELNFGINITDNDGLNETFNDTYTDSTGFRVGSVTINSEDGCSMTHPYTNEGYSTDWQELILTDNESIIFTAIIRNDANSFQKGSSHTADFQMLVLENGHWGHQTTTTPYYFYVELS